MSDYIVDDGPPLTRLENLARIAKIVALVCFLFPWLTISCSGQPVITYKGLNFVTGGFTAMVPGQDAGPMPGDGPPDGASIFVIIALAIIIGLLVLSFVWKRRESLLVGLIGSVAAIVLLIVGVVVQRYSAISGQLNEAMAREGGRFGGGPPSMGGSGDELDQLGGQLADAISVNLQIGFYLVILALVAAAVFYYLMVKGRRRLGGGSAVVADDPKA